MGVFFQDSVNSSLSHTETYTYDALNRLATAVATGNSTYNLTFDYDSFGNMTCQATLQTQGLCPNYAFDQSTNRITTAGFSYDAAGNLTQDPSTNPVNTYQWDAEGRLRAILHSGATFETLAYNAGGQVVESAYPGYNDKVEGVFDPSGKELGYYNGVGGAWWDRDIWGAGRMVAQSYASDTYFLHAGHLGSDRQITDYSGAVQTDFVYYPWEIWKYAGSQVDAHFAGFQQSGGPNYGTPFRQYSGGLGRWLSPDPVGGNVMDPQSLNRYAYALNNPTTLTDPLGLDPCDNDPNICVTVTATPPPPVSIDSGPCGPDDVVCQECYQMQVCFQPAPPGCNFYTGVGCGPGEGGGAASPPAPKPTPPGLQVSILKLIKSFNQCAANVADKYSAASLLHLNKSTVGNALLGSTTAAVSNLIFQTNPKVYVPAGANLAASAKAGAALKGTAVALGKVEVNQGFQSVFTTVAPTTIGQTAAGGTALNGAKGLADLLDVATPVLIGYDEALYGIGEGVCAAQSF